jgi:hypothetical protein
VNPTDVRNRASRVALPPTSCAVTAAAPSIERRRDREYVVMS